MTGPLALALVPVGTHWGAAQQLAGTAALITATLITATLIVEHRLERRSRGCAGAPAGTA